ncbi:hypothetical protein ACERMF_17710, partial [Egicoccus sp. AB-alg6-2]
MSFPSLHLHRLDAGSPTRPVAPRRALVAVVLLSLLFGLFEALLLGASPARASNAVDAGVAIRTGNDVHALAGTNIARGTDQLVRYTPAFGANTATNQWGAEAAVVDGVVTAIRDRQLVDAPAMPIPAGGYVLSGHGQARLTLLAGLKVGSRVGVLAPATAARGEAVLLGSSARVLAGTNVARGVDQLVLYTPAFGANTATNRWGLEAAVVNGKVTAIRDRQLRNASAMPIPAGGYVLSGHGQARTALLQLRVGSNVTLLEAASVATPSPVSPTPVAPVAPEPVALSPASTAVRVGTSDHALAGTNVARGTDQLVRYTPVFGANTGTNQWGAEAAVVDGKITAIRDRQLVDAPAMPIPTGGYVLSGHGQARTFLLANARVGTTVELDPQQAAP